MKNLRHIYLIFYKDLILEFRTREVSLPFSLFSFLLIFLLAFSIPTSATVNLAPFMYWLTFLFAGIIGLSKIVSREMEGGGFSGLLTLPVDRGALYLGKTSSLTLFSFISGVILFFLFFFFLNFSLSLFSFFYFLLIIFLVSVGFSAIGIIFAFLSYHTKAKEFMIPLLFIPVFIPPFIAAIDLTRKVINQEFLLGSQLFILLFFDVFFLTLNNVLFEQVILE